MVLLGGNIVVSGGLLSQGLGERPPVAVRALHLCFAATEHADSENGNFGGRFMRISVLYYRTA